MKNVSKYLKSLERQNLFPKKYLKNKTKSLIEFNISITIQKIKKKIFFILVVQELLIELY